MRIVGIFLQTLAIGIILLHSIVPHRHHSDFTESEHLAQHEEASGFLDFLSLAFHVDQEGHLENFTTESDTELGQLEFIPPFSFEEVVSTTCLVEQKINHYSCTEITLHDDFTRKANSLRGPPSLS